MTLTNGIPIELPKAHARVADFKYLAMMNKQIFLIYLFFF
jgi:hypothetical protein